VKQFVKKLIHEPLFHFLLIGAGLFLIFGWRGGPVLQPGGQPGSQSTKIIVTQGQIEHMKAKFTRTWQRQPAEQELKGLIDEYVLDEISYREATALGLDRDDPTIRRRMRLKLETLNEDIAAASSPTDQDLADYLAQHPESFLREPQVAFRQVYLNTDLRGRKVDEDAQILLTRLRAAGTGVDLAGFGDPLMIVSNDLPLSTVSEIERRFGEQFGRNLVKLEPGQWEGPVKSGFGLHLVLVTELKPARLPELAEIRDQVEREWLYLRKKEIQEALYKKLREQYTVVVEQPPGTEGKGAAVAATLPSRGAQ
jgi:PPIC-type PPIASE domain